MGRRGYLPGSGAIYSNRSRQHRLEARLVCCFLPTVSCPLYCAGCVYFFVGSYSPTILRDGGTSQEVMEQLCATLRSSKPTSSGVGEAEAGLEHRALLMALRGVSLAGGSIGADEASSFRKVS